MTDVSDPVVKAPAQRLLDGAPVVAVTEGAVETPGEGQAERTATLALFEETLTVTERDVVTGKVRVSTTTKTRDEIAEVELDRSIVNVTRIQVGRPVDVAPAVRTEGDTTIVPVIEERLIVTKQLFLVEELHIRHHVERQMVRETVPLRRQHATVHRLDAEGTTVEAIDVHVYGEPGENPLD